MLLREFDKIVGELLFSYAGEIRTIPVQIGGTSWEPEMPHTGIIMESINEIEQIEDFELRALKYFCYIARTQMFIDGNKRVAQLMANKVLIENNIGIFQIPIEKLEEFKGILIEFYETGSDTKIISFMKEYCIRRIQGQKDYFMGGNDECGSFLQNYYRNNCYGEYVENAETADGLPVCQDLSVAKFFYSVTELNTWIKYNTSLNVENCEYGIKGVYFPEENS